MTAIKPPMTYFGGKTRIAARIAALMPDHNHYLEPFAGSLAVLLAKSPSKHETVNDTDGHLMTFWRVLRDRPAELARVCILTPHAREAQIQSYEQMAAATDELEIARLVWIQVTQGRAGLRSKTGWRQYIDPAGTRTPMPGYLEAYVERMAAAAERLHNVSLENRPALELVESFGRVSDVLIYADPPYLASTRTNSGRYLHEMNNVDEHRELAEALLAARAAVIVSGYPSSLYDELYGAWDRVDIPTMTGQGGTNARRLEVIWSNRPISQPHLFTEDTA